MMYKRQMVTKGINLKKLFFYFLFFIFACSDAKRYKKFRPTIRLPNELETLDRNLDEVEKKCLLKYLQNQDSLEYPKYEYYVDNSGEVYISTVGRDEESFFYIITEDITSCVLNCDF